MPGTVRVAVAGRRKFALPGACLIRDAQHAGMSVHTGRHGRVGPEFAAFNQPLIMLGASDLFRAT